MYALPDDFDSQLLAGCYLEMVCFGVSTTKLNFSRPQAGPGSSPYRIVFSVETKLSYRLKNFCGVMDFF